MGERLNNKIIIFCRKNFYLFLIYESKLFKIQEKSEEKKTKKQRKIVWMREINKKKIHILLFKYECTGSDKQEIIHVLPYFTLHEQSRIICSQIFGNFE